MENYQHLAESRVVCCTSYTLLGNRPHSDIGGGCPTCAGLKVLNDEETLSDHYYIGCVVNKGDYKKNCKRVIIFRKPVQSVIPKVAEAVQSTAIQVFAPTPSINMLPVSARCQLGEGERFQATLSSHGGTTKLFN